MHAEELESLHRPGKPLDGELANERRLDPILERRVRTLAQQYLSGGRGVTQPRAEVRHGPESAAVVPSFESDSAERGVSDCDAGAEPQLVAAFAPADGKLADTVPHRDRQSRRLRLVVGDGHRVVEEDHQAVPGKVLENPAVRADE